MKKVDVVFSASLNSIIGPVQTLKRIISNYSFFAEKGYDLTLFTLDNKGGTKSLNLNQVQSVAKRSQSPFTKKIKEFARYLAQHSFLYDALRIELLLSEPNKFAKNYLSQNREVQVIVFHYVYDCYNYLKHEKNVKAKIVLFIHGDSAKSTMLFDYFPKAKGTIIEKKLDKINRFVFSKVDKVISISKVAAKNFTNEYPMLEGKVQAVVNGIDDIMPEQKIYLDKKRKDSYPRKYRLISCGSINGRKGQWIVIDALGRLPEEKRNSIDYTIVGDGPERVTLENKAKEYGLNNVKFVGSVPNVEVYKYLAGANIAVLMSRNEGLPLSLIEALRCGLAGISTKVAAIPEVIIDGYNGVLIEPNVDQLSDILMHIGDYDWDEMGRRSLELFESEYTFNRMREDYLEMLNSLSIK